MKTRLLLILNCHSAKLKDDLSSYDLVDYNYYKDSRRIPENEICKNKVFLLIIMSVSLYSLLVFNNNCAR